MNKQSEIIQRTSEYVFELLKEKLPKHVVYHNFQYAQSVSDAAHKLAKGLELSDDAVEIVTIAGLLHSTGITQVYANYEEFSKKIAQEFLQREEYPEDKITYVLGCIEATKTRELPTNLLEEIVCDATKSYLGKKSFSDRSSLLRLESENISGQVFTDEEWIQKELDLLTHHTYFTEYAHEIFDEQIQENIRTREKQLRKQLMAIEQNDSHSEKSVTSGMKLGKSDEDAESTDEGIIHNLDRDQIVLYGQADNKAGMMLLVNSLLIVCIAYFFVTHDALKSGFVVLLILVLFVTSLLLSALVLMQGLGKDNYPNTIQLGKKNSYLRRSYIVFILAAALSVACVIYNSISLGGVVSL